MGDVGGSVLVFTMEIVKVYCLGGLQDDPARSCQVHCLGGLQDDPARSWQDSNCLNCRHSAHLPICSFHLLPKFCNESSTLPAQFHLPWLCNRSSSLPAQCLLPWLAKAQTQHLEDHSKNANDVAVSRCCLCVLAVSRCDVTPLEGCTSPICHPQPSTAM